MTETLRVGPADPPDGQVLILNEGAEVSIHLRGRDALLRIGGEGTAGVISVRSDVGEERIGMSGEHGNIAAGGNGADGDLVVKDSANQSVIHLRA